MNPDILIYFNVLIEVDIEFPQQLFCSQTVKIIRKQWLHFMFVKAV